MSSPSIPSLELFLAQLGEIVERADIDPFQTLQSLDIDSLSRLELLVLCDEYGVSLDARHVTPETTVREIYSTLAAELVTKRPPR